MDRVVSNKFLKNISFGKSFDYILSRLHINPEYFSSQIGFKGKNLGQQQ